MKSFESYKQDFCSYLKYLINYGWLGKFLATILILIVITVPIDIYFLFRYIFEPIGFWQNIVLFLIWGVLIGWIEVILLIFGCALILTVVYR